LGPGPFEIGLLGTRTQAKISGKTKRLAEMLNRLRRPIYLVDIRRAGVGGQGCWSPLEFASLVPKAISEPYSFFHLPSVAPSVELLSDYRKSMKLPGLSESEIAHAVSEVQAGHDPGIEAWKHWQVFREKYLMELQCDPHAVLAALAFVEASQAIGGSSVFLCAEEFVEDFDSKSQSPQDNAYCHRYTLSAAICRSLRKRHPGCKVTRIDLSLEHAEPHRYEYPVAVTSRVS
jgi:hypothetical protein